MHLAICVNQLGYGATPHGQRSEGYPMNQAKPIRSRNRTQQGAAVALSIKPVAGRVAACLDAASRPEKHCFTRY